MATSGIAFAEDKPATKKDPLTSEVWQPPDPPMDLHWHLLALPEYLIEIAFSPLALLVTLTERHRLDRRLKDALRNDAGTIGVNPRVKLSTGDGFGGGASLWFKNLFGDEQRLKLGGLARINGDFEADVLFRSSFASMEGRVVSLRLLAERDKNMPFFGLGNDTVKADRRVLQSDRVEGGVSVDLFGAGLTRVFGTVDLSFFRQELSTGDDPTVMGVAPGDTVPLPAGFGRALNFARLDVSFGVDTRDTIGRPTKGVRAAISGTAATDLDVELAAMAATLTVTGYVPILPEHRVIALSAGARASKRLPDAVDVPLELLTTLGRRDFLRGYLNGRFRDRMGWWAGAEYSYPIYEYMATGVHLHAVVFGDVGRVAADFTQLIETPVRFSWGFGVRGVHDAVEAISILIGFSREGVQFGLAAGADL